MISLYIDHKFLDLFSCRQDFDNPLVEDFLNNFLRKIRGVEVVLNVGIDDFKDKILTNKYYRYVLEITPTINFKAFEKDITLSSFYELGPPIKVFLIESIEADLLENQFGCLFINNGNLIHKWNTLRIDREDNELSITSVEKGNYIFPGWYKLKDFKHPLNSVIVFDHYILSDKGQQKLADNIIPCLRKLVQLKPREIPLHLMIISREINTSCKEKPLQSCHEKLIEKLEFKNVHLSIIRYKENNLRLRDFADSEHNRAIYTNLYLIQTGAGFNIYKGSDEKINNRDNISIRSILENKYRNIAEVGLRNIRKYIDAITENVEEKQEYVGGPKKTMENYYPDKINRLFEAVSIL